MKKLLTLTFLILFSAPAMADFFLDPATLTVRDSRRDKAPQSAWMVGKAQDVGVEYNAPVLLRVFKYEEEIEIWREKKSGEYVFMTTIKICKQGRELGPKLRQGDYQTPEGFYEFTKDSLNPQSRLWLSVRVNYPNQFDRAHGRTGGDIMIHGGCRSAGCIAIEDAPMTDLYALMRDAFDAGQEKIQVHIFPFKMHGTIPDDPKNNEFWAQLKEGYDQFLATLRPIKYRVENKRYIVVGN